MINLVFHFTGNGIHAQAMAWGPYKEEKINISFPLSERKSPREAIKSLKEDLSINPIVWLHFTNKKWQINLSELKNFLELDKFRLENPEIPAFDFLEGTITIEPDIEDYKKSFKEIIATKIMFSLTKESIMELRPQRIFLSHKGIDKPLIREYKYTLELLGFDTWLDEDALTAGTELERGILKGFKDSCAAIFFITHNYKDENYLATEIDYAIAEKRDKGERFSIITLVLNDEAKVPGLLSRYVWKTPASQLEAIREIIKALPIKLGIPGFIDNK
jgi:hypothetical protein